MIVLIDNYDSFTYNLVQKLGEVSHAGLEMKVFRNDKVTVGQVEEAQGTLLVHGDLSAAPPFRIFHHRCPAPALPLPAAPSGHPAAVPARPRPVRRSPARRPPAPVSHRQRRCA